MFENYEITKEDAKKLASYLRQEQLVSENCQLDFGYYFSDNANLKSIREEIDDGRGILLFNSGCWGENYKVRVCQYCEGGLLLATYWSKEKLLKQAIQKLLEKFKEQFKNLSNVNIEVYRNYIFNNTKKKEKSAKKIESSSEEFHKNCLKETQNFFSELLDLLKEYDPDKRSANELKSLVQYATDMFAWQQACKRSHKYTTTMYYLPNSNKKFIQVIIEVPQMKTTTKQKEAIEAIFNQNNWPEYFKVDLFDKTTKKINGLNFRQWLLRRHFSKDKLGKEFDEVNFANNMASRPAALKDMPGLANWYEQKRLLFRRSSKLKYQFKIVRQYSQFHSASHCPNSFWESEHEDIRQKITKQNIKQSLQVMTKNHNTDRPVLFLSNVAPKIEEINTSSTSILGRKNEDMMNQDVSDILEKWSKKNIQMSCHSVNAFRTTSNNKTAAVIAREITNDRLRLLEHLSEWLTIETKKHGLYWFHDHTISNIKTVQSSEVNIHIAKQFLQDFRRLIDHTKLIDFKENEGSLVIVLEATLILLENDVFKRFTKNLSMQMFTEEDCNISLLTSSAEEVIYIYTDCPAISRNCMSGCDRTQIGMAFTSAFIASREIGIYSMKELNEIFICDLLSYHGSKTVSHNTPGRIGLKSFEGGSKKFGVIPTNVIDQIKIIDPVFMPFTETTSKLNILECEKSQKKLINLNFISNKIKEKFISSSLTNEIKNPKKDNEMISEKVHLLKENILQNRKYEHKTKNNKKINNKLNKKQEFAFVSYVDKGKCQKSICGNYWFNLVTRDYWTVTYAYYSKVNKKTNTKHAFILVEGIRDEKPYFLRAEFLYAEKENKNIVELHEKTPALGEGIEKEFKILKCRKNLLSNSFIEDRIIESFSVVVKKDKVESMIQKMKLSKNEINNKKYSPTGSVINSINCIEWAKEMLEILKNEHLNNKLSGFNIVHFNNRKISIEKRDYSCCVSLSVKMPNKKLLKGPVIPEGLCYQKVPGDGHCLYHAVTLYLNKEQQVLREEVAEELTELLRSNDTNILPVIKSKLSKNQTLEGYIQAIRNGDEWADDLEICTLMGVYQRPIVVLGYDGKIRNKLNIEKYLTAEPIFVVYNDRDHYDALICDGKISAREILNNLLQLKIKQQLIPKIKFQKSTDFFDNKKNETLKKSKESILNDKNRNKNNQLPIDKNDYLFISGEITSLINKFNEFLYMLINKECFTFNIVNSTNAEILIEFKTDENSLFITVEETKKELHLLAKMFRDCLFMMDNSFKYKLDQNAKTFKISRINENNRKFIDKLLQEVNKYENGKINCVIF